MEEGGGVGGEAAIVAYQGINNYDIRPAGRAPRYSDTPFTIGDGRSRLTTSGK